ncbi:hypothetical protein BUL40_15375 [Croceivirga radicis]|uniref:Uncharacterized protein n=1 Tax=Croceivirga radicis TaxID=1929488 RepID=A0A1V6LN20_9FLAO|nr:hypothetical protein [Croceivirga radicis]OQD41584.1 hypothetical protein BUL40_15375 [Croceivirga radicis]
MITDQVPLGLSILFLIAFLAPLILIVQLVRQYSSNINSVLVLLFYLFFLLGVLLLQYNGYFNAVSLPPRIIVLTTLPLLAFYLIVIHQTTFYKNLVQNTPLAAWVQLHLFRLIGGFFLVLWALNTLPKTFALIAGTGDIITALSSLYVASTIRQKKSYAKRLTWIWNTFGLLDILATSFTAVLLTKWNIETGSMGVDILTTFPYCFIPAFAPATIIFLHVTIYKKLLKWDTTIDVSKP